MDDVDKDFGDLKSILKGNTSLMFSEVSNVPAKIIKDFRKKSEKPLLKGAFVEESIYIGDNQISALVSLKYWYTLKKIHVTKTISIISIIVIVRNPTLNVGIKLPLLNQ